MVGIVWQWIGSERVGRASYGKFGGNLSCHWVTLWGKRRKEYNLNDNNMLSIKRLPTSHKFIICLLLCQVGPMSIGFCLNPKHHC